MYEKKYIEKKNTDLAIALAKKGYYTKVKPLLEKELRALISYDIQFVMIYWQCTIMVARCFMAVLDV